MSEEKTDLPAVAKEDPAQEKTGLPAVAKEDPAQEKTSLPAVAKEYPAQEKTSPSSRPYRPTVEIPCIILYFCTAVTGTAMANVLIHRTCVHSLGYSAQACEQLQAAGERPPDVQAIESEVQRFNTVIYNVKAVMDGLIPATLAMFLGAWSNTHGRKPLVMWPSFGFALSMGLLTMYSYADALGPWWFVGTSLPLSFAGGTSAFTTGAFCLINDVSTEQNRTVRISLMQSSIFLGVILGLLSSSFLYGIVGTSNLITIALCLSVCGFLYAVFLIKESVENTVGGGVCTIFDLALVKDMFQTYFRRRPSYGRLVLQLVVIANLFDLFVVHGISAIEYLYVRQKLSWTLTDQNLFSAVNTFILIFGVFFGVFLLQRVFKLTDVVTTLISYVSCSLEAIVRALANSTWVMYFGSVISVFRGLSSPLVRSMISKRVPREDVAKIFALMSAVDSLFPVVAPLFYNTIYRQTLDTAPGAVFFINGGIYVISFIFMWAARSVMVRHPLQRDPVSEDVATKL